MPHESLSALFRRFLHFGLMAWGGPVAQIAMLRHAFVDEERWVTSAHFNRVLALYQVLPGPEAHELCVYFGTLARGRVGGLLAGAGFMLPGFVLMFALSWLYVQFGLDLHGPLALLFAAVQAAVVALIVRAVHRIGSHVLLDRWLWAIGIVTFAAHLAGVHFAILLVAGGAAYTLARWKASAGITFVSLCVIAVGIYAARHGVSLTSTLDATEAFARYEPLAVPLTTLLWSGLKAGLLTFGGAYTAIPFLQRDAVSQSAWMSNAQFMDGIALSGLLPAPLIIFSTFVGFLGGGPLGAIAMTLGVFLPAFLFPMVAHDPMERLLHRHGVREFLDGVTAAVVGLIAATACGLLIQAITSVFAAVVFVLALLALIVWNRKLTVPLVIAGALIAGAVAVLLTR